MENLNLKVQSQGLHGKADQIEPALIFIADISGFTHFVTQTPILHSKDIISELLEAVIQSNQIDLEISEIEGDAILFYRFGEAPSLDEITAQLNAIYTIFEELIRGYENTRLCCCIACDLTMDLAIKVIVHYGPVTSMVVGEFDKLIGPAVIAIHRLLKNSVGLEQYALLTEGFVNAMSGKKTSDNLKMPPWKLGQDEYEHIGVMKYHYTDYPFSDRTKDEGQFQLDLENMEEMLALSASAPMDWVHHVIIDPILQGAHGDITTELEEPRKVFRIGSVFTLNSATSNYRCKTVLNNVEPDHIQYALELMDTTPQSRFLIELKPEGTNCALKISATPESKQDHKEFISVFANQLKQVSELEYNAKDWAAGIF